MIPVAMKELLKVVLPVQDPWSCNPSNTRTWQFQETTKGSMEGENAKFACIAVSAHPRAVYPTNALFFNFFLWSEVIEASR